GSGRGGYYQDDGPGDAPPAGLLDVPDAEVTLEPYSRTGNKPYVVFGKTYVPMKHQEPFTQRGVASWYGKKFHGQRTSSGEPYDMYKMSAAHPTLPIPSYARITNLANGKQIIVRVNDRGPFHSTRVIDLSYTAALKLGYLGKGSHEVQVDRILPAEIQDMLAQRRRAQVGNVAIAASNKPSVSAPVENAVEAMLRSDQPLAIAGEVRLAHQPEAPQESPAKPPGFYLQLGAFSQAHNAEAARAQLARSNTHVAQQGNLYKLFAGPYATRADAQQAAGALRGGGTAPLIVER
ncbi:MAG TPA: septal ring lytic transglycosylase RlpA family protein, partial [Burkholderiaceae bacterium]